MTVLGVGQAEETVWQEGKRGCCTNKKGTIRKVHYYKQKELVIGISDSQRGMISMELGPCYEIAPL